MDWLQRQITLPAYERGFHLITHEILRQLPELAQFDVGMMHLLLLHTSASLALNENADPTVRSDMLAHFDRHLTPPGMPYYRHTYEGPDDTTAHLQALLIGSGLLLPLRRGRPVLGTWQGIYLCEHRHHAGRRRLMVTVWGEKGA